MENIGRYRIQETLGKGGMGVVYRARDPELERDVAIKVVLAWAQYDEEAMARFDREAKVVAQLQHPHIVTVFDAGRTDDGLPYFVMEYLKGTDLSETLGLAGALPPSRALRYAIQVCEGLAYAHARDIVHRDMKPANLLITPDDNVKIVDFGIARITDSRLTGTGVSMGTPLFMAPEQVAGMPVDQRADIFAMGSVIYAMLTGRSPFDAPTMGAICTKIEKEDPPPLAEHGVRVSPRLEAALRRALEKDPDRRYQSAQALADDLHAIHDEPDELSSAPTVITASSATTSPAAPTVPLEPRKRFPVWVVPAAAAIVFGALVAWPNSPLRRGDTETAVVSAPEPAAPTTPSDEGTGETTDVETAQEIVSQPVAAGDEAQDRTPEQPVTAVPEPEAAADPGTERPAMQPATAEDRAAVEPLVNQFARAVETKDSAAIARIYGGRIPDRDWRMLERLIAAPQLRMQPQIVGVSRTEDGALVATVRQEIRMTGDQRQARMMTWGMIFRQDRSGRLHLRSIVSRQQRN
jgi:serine/threonine-protein kinase